MKNVEPLVSIDCITYNHEAFISEAIESFLMQKTDFTFEILIHDDASTDQTATIIRDYEKKYPDIIKPIYQKENQYSQDVEISRQFQFPRAMGKYIAFCEGDDYWTDPYKLQKQVDFLEAHPDHGLVHCNFDKLYNKTGRIVHNTNKNNKILNSSKIDIINGLLTYQFSIGTLTVLARTKLLSKAINNIDVSGHMMSDLPLWFEMAQLTKFHYLRESVGVYRKVQGSASNDRNTYRAFIESGSRIRLDFAKKYSAPIDIKNKLQRAYLRCLLLKAFYSKDQQLGTQYCNYMKENNLALNLFDRLIYLSIKNKILHALLSSFDKIKWTLIFISKFIVRKNV